MDIEAMKETIAKLALLFPEEKRYILAKTMEEILPKLGKDLKALNNPDCIAHINNNFKFRDTDIILVSFPKTGENKTFFVCRVRF